MPHESTVLIAPGVGERLPRRVIANASVRCVASRTRWCCTRYVTSVRLVFQGAPDLRF
ncbi:hypothetical protein [Streptomyces sp. SD15]